MRDKYTIFFSQITITHSKLIDQCYDKCRLTKILTKYRIIASTKKATRMNPRKTIKMEQNTTFDTKYISCELVCQFSYENKAKT